MRNKFVFGFLCLTLAGGSLTHPAFAAKKDDAKKAVVAEKEKEPEVKAPTVEDYVRSAGGFIQKKDYQSAIKEYENALKLDVKNAKVNLLLGLTYANTGAVDKAIRYTMFSLTTEPSYSGYHNLGLMYANKGDYKQAIEFHQKALAINPSSHRSWYQLGLVQQANSQYKEAVASYQKAVSLNPAMTDAHLGMGGAYYWSGNLEGALSEARVLRELGAVQEADQLEAWIKNKEAKKAAAEKKPEAAKTIEPVKQPETPKKA